MLEAGGKDSNPWIKIPLGYAKLYANPKVNWCYESEPEINLNNRCLFQPRGKVLGGSGAINGMIYVRGQAADFDGWEAQGCEGWGFNSVMPYFLKCEDQERGVSQYHAVGGPVSVADLPSKEILGEAFHEASKKLGSPYNNDFNGESQVGTGYVQVTTKNARRWSTADGYLKGKIATNITVVTHVMVNSLVLERGQITGVNYSDKSGTYTARATKEVIISAGTFNSPKLLELLGIGNREVLESKDIAVQHELRGVGENLQDHFGIWAQYRASKPVTVNDLSNNVIKGGLALMRYLLFKTGPFANNGNYSNAFINSSQDVDRPDMMITFMGWCTGENLRPRPFSGFTILAEHIRPDCRGTVHVRSDDPREQPIIKFNFLESDADKKAAIEGLKHARKIAQTAPMSGFVAEELKPGSDKVTDEQLLEHCRSEGLSLLHCVGTCKMGVDELSVVDSRLKVHGLKGVRVIDASIMPTIVSGNTNAAAIMIGEKGAQMVIDDWCN